MRRLIVGLVALVATGCSSPAPETPQASAPAPAATSAAPQLATTDVVVPPRTRDPFETSVGRPKLPATQPMKRVSTSYPKAKRDPFVSVTGKPNQATLASHAADPDAGARIAKPGAPDLKVVSVQKNSAQVSANGQLLKVGVGDFVMGCRVQSIDRDRVTVTRSGVPFTLSAR
jgi:hypothetical protein